MFFNTLIDINLCILLINVNAYIGREKRFPLELRTMRNSKDQTPNDAFYVKHRKLCKQAKVEAKGLVKFNMLVATLIAVILVHALIANILGDCAKCYVIFF